MSVFILMCILYLPFCIATLKHLLHFIFNRFTFCLIFLLSHLHAKAKCAIQFSSPLHTKIHSKRRRQRETERDEKKCSTSEGVNVVKTHFQFVERLKSYTMWSEKQKKKKICTALLNSINADVLKSWNLFHCNFRLLEFSTTQPYYRKIKGIRTGNCTTVFYFCYSKLYAFGSVIWKLYG